MTASTKLPAKKKTYSLGEASELVPFLQAIANEIREERDERASIEVLLEDLATGSSRRSPEGFDSSTEELQFRARELDWSLSGCRRELEGLGLTVQRMKPLTVHIPGQTRTGELVFCWEEGETRIGHGHECGEEDEPRRPLKIQARS